MVLYKVHILPFPDFVKFVIILLCKSGNIFLNRKSKSHIIRQGCVVVLCKTSSGSKNCWKQIYSSVLGAITQKPRPNIDYATPCVCNAGFLSNQHENGQAIARWIAN